MYNLCKNLLLNTTNAISSLIVISVLLYSTSPSLAMDPLSIDLPDDTVDHVCSHLSLRHLARVALVSHQWQKAGKKAEENILWQSFGVTSKAEYIKEYKPIYESINAVIGERKPDIYGHKIIKPKKGAFKKLRKKLKWHRPTDNFLYKDFVPYSYPTKIQQGHKPFSLAEGQGDVLDFLVLSCFKEIKNELYEDINPTKAYIALITDLIGKCNIGDADQDPSVLTLTPEKHQLTIRYVYNFFEQDENIKNAETRILGNKIIPTFY